jgi:hypothetical protein
LVATIRARAEIRKTKGAEMAILTEALRKQIAQEIEYYRLTPARFDIAYAYALQIAAKPGAVNPATVAWLGHRHLMELDTEAAIAAGE